MYSFSVVKELNIPKQLVLRFFLRLEFCTVDEFSFENTVKRFNASIVVAVPSAAHAANHMVSLELFPVLYRGVLTSAVGMVDQSFPGLLCAVGLVQGR
ncbi:hypothetical protein D3C75_1055720 [compost metagenome]